MKLTTSQKGLLNEMIDNGFISVQKHPTEDLYIYNYTAKAQFEYLWNEITLACRGLILDSELNIIARPFQKFFNYGEEAPQKLPEENFEVFEKLDGSLGIMYWVHEKPYLATRGSFTSSQALKGTTILHHKYAHLFENLNKSWTYLFEIIYPENRIVVNYDGVEDIILTAIIDTHSGIEQSIENKGFKYATKYDGINDIELLKNRQEENKEGYVIKYSSAYRVKIKFEEYIRLHRIITNVSTITIWEFLSTYQEMTLLIEKVPDEFYTWIKKTEADLINKYKEIETKCLIDYKELDSKKETAIYFLTCQYPNILFAKYNKKKYDHIIWKMIKPKHDRPFTNFTDHDN